MSEVELAMTEYIDKNALLKDLSSTYNCTDECWSSDCTMGFRRAVDIVNKASPLNVAIVKHGRWIDNQWIDYDEYLKCSKCGVMVRLNSFFDDIGDWNYCPNCGTKMNGCVDNETD